MKFDIDRLSQLAGIGSSARHSLNEAGNRSQHEEKYGQDEVPFRHGKGQLAEREALDAYEEVDEDELEEKLGGKKRDKSKTDPGDEDYTWRAKDEGSDWGMGYDEEPRTPGHGKDYIRQEQGMAGTDDVPDVSELDVDGDVDELVDPLGELDDDVVLELDEGMLRKELMRMKKERVNETKLRKAIRGEIKNIFKSLNNESASWVYGEDKPTRSRDGYVTQPGRAFPGVGFKS